MKSEIFFHTFGHCCTPLDKNNSRLIVLINMCMWEITRGHVKNHPMDQKKQHLKRTWYKNRVCCTVRLEILIIPAEANSKPKGHFAINGEKWTIMTALVSPKEHKYTKTQKISTRNNLNISQKNTKKMFMTTTIPSPQRGKINNLASNKIITNHGKRKTWFIMRRKVNQSEPTQNWIKS